MLISKKYLVFKVNLNAKMKRVDFMMGEKRVLYFNMRLDEFAPDYKVYINVEKYIGKEIGLNVTPEAEFTAEQSDEYIVEGAYNEPYRPQIHFAPYFGWNNDPNGLVYLNGVYHLFYQHNPCEPNWENMSWAHATSTDLIHWEERDVALYPDEFGTMFSGSAIVDTKNLLKKQKSDIPTIILYYTAASQSHTKEKAFTQCMAYSTDGGKTFTKYENNPVIKHKIGDNRDPKIVWCPELECYLLALFLDGEEYAIFKTDDLVHFTEWFRFNTPEENECPDIFRIKADDGKFKWVFIGAHDVYITGEIIGGKFIPDGNYKKLHNGAWYASQTYSDAPGDRRIRIEWMRTGSFIDKNYSQHMGIPTEITLKNIGKEYYLASNPVKELDSYIKSEDIYEDFEIEAKGKSKIYVGTDPILITINSEYTENGKLNLKAFGNDIGFDFDLNEVYIGKIKNKISLKKENFDAKILIDRSSIEVFTDGGIYTITNAGTFHGSALMDRNLPYVELSSEKNITLKEIKINTFKSAL
ncbi:MAG: glycoside hydrolase family 32 protein [Ruminococcaceae bacterium]|nr:glycoside hydrolase family 32 protein [Oscillospiraceae bacterium]